jgi:hypothetical protein
LIRSKVFLNFGYFHIFAHSHASQDSGLLRLRRRVFSEPTGPVVCNIFCRAGIGVMA